MFVIVHVMHDIRDMWNVTMFWSLKCSNPVAMEAYECGKSALLSDLMYLKTFFVGTIKFSREGYLAEVI